MSRQKRAVEPITLTVNGRHYTLTLDPQTPLLYVLRNDLGLKGPKYGCGEEQCNACKVLIDGNDAPSCRLPVQHVEDAEIVTIEGLGVAGALHPLQEAFVEEQAIQCGYCAAGMIIAAQGLLNRVRYPSDEEIRAALDDNLCRCGVYERVRRAIRLRIGRFDQESLYTVIDHAPGAYPVDAAGKLPVSLQETPQLDAWIRITPDGYVDVFTGKVEIGQGIKTAVTQIAADELDVDPMRIRVLPVDTDHSPDEGITAGSMSLQMTGSAIRQAAAEVREILLQLAHEELEAKAVPDMLAVNDGTITDPESGRSISYWTLFGGRRFGRTATGTARPKPAEKRRVVGQSLQRLDLVAKVTGIPSFVHDLELPGMLHGRVVRPPAYGARLETADTRPVEEQPGVVKVVRDGSFLAVIAEREEQAIAAMEQLRAGARWSTSAPLPRQAQAHADLVNAAADSYQIIDGRAVADPISQALSQETAGDRPAQRVAATYHRPFQMHGALGPSAAVACFEDGNVTVWSHTQGPYILRGALAQALGMDAEHVRVVHMEGAGCFGHNGADDAAFDAALLARAIPGRPISLKWMRADEHMWEPYGPEMVVHLEATLDRNDTITAWNHDVWSYPHSTRPRAGEGVSGLLAAWHRERSLPRPRPRAMVGGRHAGSFRNADPLYAFTQKRIVTHFVAESPLRTSSMRGLGAYANIFAIESFIDELASAAGEDPVALRLRHLTDTRARAVIEAAVKKAGWTEHRRPAGTGRGRGMAFAQYKNLQCYAAVVVDVEVDPKSGEIRLVRAVIAADAGEIVNPDGLSNQLEGGFLQAASWTLFEEVQYAPGGIVSRDWDTYPILRFSAVPVIQTVLLNRPDLPFLGSGEATQGPTPAAIANAVYDAVGVRLRRIPFTPARVLEACSMQR